jgi:hypothetical protein
MLITGVLLEIPDFLLGDSKFLFEGGQQAMRDEDAPAKNPSLEFIHSISPNDPKFF